MKFSHTNELIHSTSPYLLQHAHNPVNWRPWSDKIIEEAKKENKLILVSIGYRITSYNVCYTKLLRVKEILELKSRFSRLLLLQ